MKSIEQGSPASGTIIVPGDILRRINGKVIGDVLDYSFLSYDGNLLLELRSPDGKIKLVRVRKPEGAALGLEFETYLMDMQKSCANRCVFCFVDQLPDGMRETLYYKDDDVRLSFLQGNYITLTNLAKRDIDRIIKLRVSPLNISVHTLDPELRAFMLGTNNGADLVDTLRVLTNAEITLNCQIVCCPGINDGSELSRTIEGLIELGGRINSVSVVPVGLTKHRAGLPLLRGFDRELAINTVRQVEMYGEYCLRKRGKRVFFCADELYIKAGLKIPANKHYEDYPQLENGVGMTRLLTKQFMDELRECGMQNLECVNSECGMRNAEYSGQREDSQSRCSAVREPFSVATGEAACENLTNLLKIVTKNCDKISGKVYAIKNDFFGDSVTVSGLVTGGDIISQLSGKNLGNRLLIPQNMLRSGEEVFLDDVTVTDVSKTLGVAVRVVGRDGADLLHAFLE